VYVQLEAGLARTGNPQHHRAYGQMIANPDLTFEQTSDQQVFPQSTRVGERWSMKLRPQLLPKCVVF
jgi:hypothetical protein